MFENDVIELVWAPSRSPALNDATLPITSCGTIGSQQLKVAFKASLWALLPLWAPHSHWSLLPPRTSSNEGWQDLNVYSVFSWNMRNSALVGGIRRRLTGPTFVASVMKEGFISEATHVHRLKFWKLLSPRKRTHCWIITIWRCTINSLIMTH